MPGRQRGVVVLFYMVGLVAVIGMAGFALDLGLMMLTMTRLQNALDAAALDGARELFLSGGSTSEAEAAAHATFAANIAGAVVPTVTFSPTQSPFTAGGLDPRFVLVAVDAWPVTTYLSQIVGLAAAYELEASAMAGPMPISQSCGAPMGLCGDPGSADSDCADGNGCFGISVGEITLHDDATGPGNYGMLQMGSGFAGVANGMAGGESLCVEAGESIATQPGMGNNIRFPTNTRFAQYQGNWNDPAQYPGDVVTTAPLVYTAYELLLQTGPHGNPAGVPRRRTMLMPVIDCTGVSGMTNVPVLGHACMFLTRPVPTSGPTAGTVYAQIIDECLGEGGVPDPDSETGAVQFMLFQASDKA